MYSQPSVMKHDFSMVPQAEIPRSSFDRSHGTKTTLDAGYLVPIFVDEALPGDTYTLNMTAFGRLATPLHPFMDNMFMDTQFFAVPLRLLWDNWERFNGSQDNPEDTTDYLTPTMTSPAGGYDQGTLSDYFGIPTQIDNLEHTALVHRAYNLIWNEWYRDQNLQESVTVNTDDGPDVSTDYQLLRRGKRHDYFTSALPWPQKGPAVEMPLGEFAPVIGIGKTNDTWVNNTGGAFESDGQSRTYDTYADLDSGDPNDNFIVEQNPEGGNAFPFIRADLTQATAATINALRQSFQIQKLYERDARGGTRYTEIIRSHFGVTSPDARLQRPEFLGSGTTPININPVPQTSQSDLSGPDESPQGNLAAFGTLTANNHGFSKSFTEHCILIGLVSVRADLNYQQGLNRMWSRSTRWDYYWPALSHIGEQAIANKEIYAQGTAEDDAVFGYQERHAEYRYKPSLITGKFRSNDPQTLDSWHLAQDFANLPTLSPSFIEEDPPVSRVIAIQDEPHIILDIYHKLTCARPMPMYSVPGLIDHF